MKQPYNTALYMRLSRDDENYGDSVSIDIVNIGLHFFLKNVRPMLPPVTKHNTAVA